MSTFYGGVLYKYHASLFVDFASGQVVFSDSTEILLSKEARVVTFVDKDGARETSSLQRVVEDQRWVVGLRNPIDLGCVTREVGILFSGGYETVRFAYCCQRSGTYSRLEKKGPAHVWRKRREREKYIHFDQKKIPI